MSEVRRPEMVAEGTHGPSLVGGHGWRNNSWREVGLLVRQQAINFPHPNRLLFKP